MINSNAYMPFFRVNSVYWDPSIYGRFLVLAILACLVLVLMHAPRRWVATATAAIVALWIGLAALVLAVELHGARGRCDRRCSGRLAQRAAIPLMTVALLIAPVWLMTSQVRANSSTGPRAGLSSITSTRSTLVGMGSGLRSTIR